jgi:glycosyltransferase involved in cell wall biosynthesis
VRVLFVSCDPREGAVTRYRCTHLAEALRAAGHHADIATIYDPVVRLEHELVVLHRICANEEGQALAKAARRSGARLIYGADDLVWDEGPLAASHRAMLQQADAALVSTDALARFACEAGAREATVVRNTRKGEPLSTVTVPESLWRDIVWPEACFGIFYPAGTATHNADLAQVAPALRNVLRRHPQARLILMGPLALPESLQECAAQVLTLPLVPFEQYLGCLSFAQLVIAPLEPTRFNQGKSELKWIEAASAQKPTLASRWGGFAEAIHDGQDGLLAQSPDEWEEKLCALVADPSLGEHLGQAASERARAAHQAMETQVPRLFSAWEGTGPIQPVVFSNPRGFVKGLAKQALRRLRA